MAALYAKTTKGWYFVDETPALIKGAASQSPHARTVILSMHQPVPLMSEQRTVALRHSLGLCSSRYFAVDLRAPM